MLRRPTKGTAVQLKGVKYPHDLAFGTLPDEFVGWAVPVVAYVSETPPYSGQEAKLHRFVLASTGWSTGLKKVDQSATVDPSLASALPSNSTAILRGSIQTSIQDGKSASAASQGHVPVRSSKVLYIFLTLFGTYPFMATFGYAFRKRRVASKGSDVFALLRGCNLLTQARSHSLAMLFCLLAHANR